MAYRVNRRRDRLLACDADFGEFFGRRLVGEFAQGAEASNESLSHGEFERRADEERLDAHIDESREGAGSVVCM